MTLSIKIPLEFSLGAESVTSTLLLRTRVILICIEQKICHLANELLHLLLLFFYNNKKLVLIINFEIFIIVFWRQEFLTNANHISH